eukprot:365338-Chlamydomonas_euryale.AAC.14
MAACLYGGAACMYARRILIPASDHGIPAQPVPDLASNHGCPAQPVPSLARGRALIPAVGASANARVPLSLPHITAAHLYYAARHFCCSGQLAICSEAHMMFETASSLAMQSAMSETSARLQLDCKALHGNPTDYHLWTDSQDGRGINWDEAVVVCTSSICRHVRTAVQCACTAHAQPHARQLANCVDTELHVCHWYASAPRAARVYLARTLALAACSGARLGCRSALALPACSTHRSASRCETSHAALGRLSRVEGTAREWEHHSPQAVLMAHTAC